MDSHCDQLTGQCMCRDNYIGQQCRECLRGYYGFPACTACECNHAGTVSQKCGNTRGQCECRDDGQCPCKVSYIDLSSHFVRSFKAKMYAISSDTHQLQFLKLHHFKLERI